MAPTPSSKSHTPRSKFNQILHRTPQFKHRLNNLGAKENPAAEHPVEVIGRIRDNPENDPILQINADRNSLRVKTEIGYRDFTLDGVSSSENDDLGSFYNKFIESRINGVKLGEKCTIMMYGPTGSGKSYTMFGCGKQPGIVYRSLRGILGEDDEENEGLGSFVQVTVLEIYNEEIYDLLSTNGGGGLGWPKGNSSKVRLEVMGKKAKNATFISGTEAGKISKEIQSVEKRRIVKSTLCNERSSRSHCMIILDVPTVGGRLMLVDMAGSENIEQAGQIGFEAKMQTGKINQGNIALKRVVESIANGDSHVPFRDSKLTMLLQDSFEDDKSKILMVLCASPDSKEMHKTISTLEYGAKAKCIVRGPHMPIKDKIGNEESFLAMNQFVLKLQMENKLKKKERKEAQKELTLKEEEISSLKAKLAKVESTGSSEEEINRKVNERTEMIKRELEKKILECEKMASQFIELEKRKMEEKILQQQKEVEMLKRRVEDTELELIRAKERNGEDYKATEIYEHGLAKRLLDMYADEDPGMVKSMDLDRSMDFDNKPIFAHNPVNNSNVVFMNNINLLANNSDEDHAVYDTNFSSKVPLSTVFEDEEEDEDEEKLDEEVQKEVIEEKTIYSSSSKELNVHSLDYLKDQLGENYTNIESRDEVKSANTTAFNRNERIENIFTLCGNYREISYPNETPVKTNGGNVVDNSVSLDKSMSQKIGNFDITKFDLKENHEPLVSNGDEVEVQVQWEVSKDQPGKLITSLKVVKDATIADLRKLIEIHFGANKQGFVFLAHEDSTGAPPVLKKKEATMPVTKLPLCTQTKVHLAYLCPLSEEKQFYPNQPPFTPLQNILNVTVTR